MRAKITYKGQAAQLPEGKDTWESDRPILAEFLNLSYNPDDLRRDPGAYYPDVYAEIINRLSKRPGFKILEFKPLKQGRPGTVY